MLADLTDNLLFKCIMTSTLRNSSWWLRISFSPLSLEAPEGVHGPFCNMQPTFLLAGSLSSDRERRDSYQSLLGSLPPGEHAVHAVNTQMHTAFSLPVAAASLLV